MQTGTDQKSCCKTLCFFIFWFLLHICPVIGQIRALYILCNYESHLGSEKSSDRSMAHASLFVSTYGVGYIAFYILYYFFKFYFEGWAYGTNNRKTFSGFLCLTFVSFFTYWVFLLCEWYVDLWKFGLENIKQDKTDFGERLCKGHLVLMLVTGGLYTIWLLLKGYVDLWEFGLKNIEENKGTQCERFFKGHLILTLVSFGIYIYVYMWKTGLKYTEDNEKDECKRFFGGHLMLTIVTGGLYVVWKLFKLYLDTWSWGLKGLEKEGCRYFWSYVVLTIVSFGLYIPVRLLYGYYRLWSYGLEAIKDDLTRLRGQVALSLASFGLYLVLQAAILYIDGWKYGIEQRKKREFGESMKGHLALLFLSFFTYIIYFLGELYFRLLGCVGDMAFDNCMETWKSFFANFALVPLTFGLFLIPFVILCIIRTYSIAQKCKEDEKLHVQFCGHLLMSVITLTLYIWWKLLVAYVNKIENLWNGTKQNNETNEDNTSSKICSHVILTIITLGTYLIFQLFYQIITNIKLAKQYLEEPYDSELYQSGLNRVYVLTFGTYWLYASKKSANSIKRYFAKGLLLAINFVIYYVIYSYAIPKNKSYTEYVMWAMIVFNYLTMVIGDYLFHNNRTRYAMYVISQARKRRWRSIKYSVYDNIGYNLSVLWVNFSNWRGNTATSIGNWWRQICANYSNNHYSITNDIIHKGDNRYTEAIVEQFNPTEPPVKVSFEHVESQRINKPKRIVRINCSKSLESLLVAKSMLEKKFHERFEFDPSRKVLMFAERIDLSQNEFIRYDLESNIFVDQYAHAKEMFNRDEEYIPQKGLNKENFNSAMSLYCKTIDQYNERIKSIITIRKERNLQSVSSRLNEFLNGIMTSKV